MKRLLCLPAALLLCLAAPTPAAAQQTALAAAAVQPGDGVTVVRQIAHYRRYDGGDLAFDSLDEFHYDTVVGYGLTRDTSIMIHVPLTFRDFGRDANGSDAFDDVGGIDDIRLMAQHRFWQLDTGPIETQRAVVFGGLHIPTFTDGISSESFDPFLGAAYTRIEGRHGYNVAGQIHINTNGDDTGITFGDTGANAFRLDAAYLYRLAPVTYDIHTTGSWYATAEAFGRYETNGDREVILAPGLMYEGKRFALTLAVEVPAYQDLDHRSEQAVGLALELRILF